MTPIPIVARKARKPCPPSFQEPALGSSLWEQPCSPTAPLRMTLTLTLLLLLFAKTTHVLILPQKYDRNSKCYPTLTPYQEVCTYESGALITTGGGFSNYVSTPSYQSTVVSAYLSSGVTLPPTADFNSSNRGFPDVSALGHNYLINLNGEFEQVDG